MGCLLARQTSGEARRPKSVTRLHALSRRMRTACATLALLALGGTSPAVAADVPVRFGTHPTFERMVFDWRDAVDYASSTTKAAPP